MWILEPLKNQSWVLEKFWKSPGNLFLKKCTNPVCVIIHTCDCSRGSWSWIGDCLLFFFLFPGTCVSQSLSDSVVSSTFMTEVDKVEGELEMCFLLLDYFAESYGASSFFSASVFSSTVVASQLLVVATASLEEFGSFSIFSGFH